MKTKNKGFTLLEVIVSIVILAVISSMVLTLYASYKRITTKLTIREKIVSVVDEIFNEFTDDYKKFEEKKATNPNRIYFNSVIERTTVETDNYIQFSYEDAGNYRTLYVHVYINGVSYPIGGTDILKRTIYE